MKVTVDVIEIMWAGPYDPDWVIKNATTGSDCGIYQIYGTHSILGTETLLYIGKTEDGDFSARISAHSQKWSFASEPGTISIYLGRLGAREPMTKEKWSLWDLEIDRAETLLISEATPPYNTAGINYGSKMNPETVVLNHGKRNRLPNAVSSLRFSTSPGTPDWKIYGEERNS
jgi:hypothetical protein